MLAGEISIKRKKNLVQARSFEELLDKSIKAYINKSIRTTELVEQMIEIATTIQDNYLRALL